MKHDELKQQIRDRAATIKRALDIKCEAVKRQRKPTYAIQETVKDLVKVYGPPVMVVNGVPTANPKWPKKLRLGLKKEPRPLSTHPQAVYGRHYRTKRKALEREGKARLERNTELYGPPILMIDGVPTANPKWRNKL